MSKYLFDVCEAFLGYSQLTTSFALAKKVPENHTKRRQANDMVLSGGLLALS